MNTVRRFAASGLGIAAALALGLAGCSIFDDPSPHDISVRLTGGEGTPVQVIYSKQFQAGIDESGATHVQIFLADTVVEVLPVDLLVNVEIEKRLFVQVATLDSTQVSVAVRVDVDDRNVVDRSRTIVPSDPWRYAYLFNQQISQIVDVVF